MVQVRQSIVPSILALGAALAIISIRANAAEKPATAQVDRSFMTEAASGGMMEVELGRYAVDHAASDRVKQFGQRMVDDHTKTNDELKSLATEQSLPLPGKMNEKDREAVSRLTKLKGADFDRAYMTAMVRDHEKDVQAFREKSRSAQGPDVKAFAAKTLPTLEEHLQMAKEMTAHTGTRTSHAHSQRQ